MQLLLCVSMAAGLVAAGFTLARMHREERTMRRGGGPGLIPFQLAESTREADRHRRAWGPPGRAAARRSLRWNYGFLAAYVLLLGSAALHVAAQADAAGYRLLAGLELLAAGTALLAGAVGIAGTVLLHGTLAAHAAPGAGPFRYATTARRAAALQGNLTGGVAAVVLIGFGVVELSGRPTPAGPMLSLFAGVVVAAATFATIALRRRA